jgi:hypothetical protein
MTSEKFFKSNTALITLIAACLVVLISLSVRQVFGMFFVDFNNDLGISNTEFGLAIGIQMLGWGLSGPIFISNSSKYWRSNPNHKELNCNSEPKHFSSSLNMI